MSYFMSPQTHLGLLPSDQGGAASPHPSLGLYNPAEPVVVAPGGLGSWSQKAEQLVPAAQAWGPGLVIPEARGCPVGPSWEPQWQEYGQYCPKLPPGRQQENSCSRGRAPQVGGPSRPGPLLLCRLSPGALPAEVAGREAGSQPNICILTLAMMIAGIPTVPVPGLREEDLIRAAQAFMMTHLEPEGVVQGTQAPTHTVSGQMSLVRSTTVLPPACSWMK
ncbi:PREDICTED: spermatogenesis-associated protein 25 [Elephantulus edwardii]|uniref:spermatogenesis-associated protein 25 n=1 Tax=Elephantulus edwardii TaxID=28737 RepID=UPI0003F0A910|nr:PREDICTED: spermatogenesis-associated protein 25 [Elephantulus edwardii]